MMCGGKAQLFVCAILQHEIKLYVLSLDSFESIVFFFLRINLVGGGGGWLLMRGGRSTSSMSIRLIIVYVVLKEATVTGSIY